MPLIQMSNYKPSAEVSCGQSVKSTCLLTSRWIRTNLFLVSVLSGGVLGGLLGLLLRYFQPGETTLVLLGFPGEIFLRTFKLFLLPLVISSIATGLRELNKPVKHL
ncbi:Excitatory amino acid transporter 2 [Chamberlinius hualienensis]